MKKYPQHIIDALDDKHDFVELERQFILAAGIDPKRFEPLKHHRTQLEAALTVDGMEEIIKNGALDPKELLVISFKSGWLKVITIPSEAMVEKIVDTYNAIKNTSDFKSGKLTLKDFLVAEGEGNGIKALRVLSAQAAKSRLAELDAGNNAPRCFN